MKRFILFLAICMSGVLVACGGGDDGSEDATEPGSAGKDATEKTEEATPEEPSIPRLEGTFKIKGTYVSASGLLADLEGDSIKRDWVFEPVCPSGPCDVRLEQETSAGPVEGRLSQNGDTFTGTATTVGECSNAETGEVIHEKGFKGIYEHDVQVVASKMEGDELIATKIKGTLTATVRAIVPECEGTGKQTTEYTGSLS